MKLHPDENDRLRAGTLPVDPLEGTVPFEPRNGTAAHGKAEAAPLPFRTLAQVKADAESKPRDWKWHGFLALRTVAVVSGEPKGGKSEILAAFIARFTLGGDWLGTTLEPSNVVIVSEEGDHDLVAKLYRYGADPARIMVLSRDVVGMPPKWADMVAAAVDRASEFGAALLVIDTFSFWAAIEGEGERIEGTVREALLSLQLARNAGLATVLVHHTVKSKEVDGIAALRGSGAFAASVESVGVYRRCSKEPDDAKRKHEVFSRIGGCSSMTVERVIPTDGSTPFFRSIEPLESKPAGAANVDSEILLAVARVGGWVTRKAMPEATGQSDRTLDTRLPALVKGGKLQRVGRGINGDPFRYALPSTPPYTPTSATSATSAKAPHRGGGASARPQPPQPPHPPTGVRDGAEVGRGMESEIECPTPACGGSAADSDRRDLFDHQPDMGQARRLQDERGRS